MERIDIIDKIGRKYHKHNIENGEFSYAQALGNTGLNVADYQVESHGHTHNFIDLRFENDRLVILVETKERFNQRSLNRYFAQLQTYVHCEKAYSNKRIVAILAETKSNGVMTWYGQSVIIDKEHIKEETTIKAFEEYEDICFGKVNDKVRIVDSIKVLNEKLHAYGINEKLRSQFVGTCLLALKNGLIYKDIRPTLDEKTGMPLSTEKVVLKSVQRILEALLRNMGDSDINRASKLVILKKVLEDQDITQLHYENLVDILSFIELNVIPFINDKNTAGQDLLNLFFTTFNKYVGKSDKNQAFTPDHICDFMSKAIGVNKNSRVLDPCCGSGAFLVRALTDAMDNCDTEEDRNEVKKNQIFGIEYEDGAFGLSSTNMLIHGDGNSNVVKDSMFNRGDWIRDANINVVLMNPPYNATRNCCDPEYVRQWANNTKEDPSKGLHYVEWIARHVSPNCKMAVLLPMNVAIGSDRNIKDFKKKMLDSYTLDAVFSLPKEVFYPGATVEACCMIFDLSQSHIRTNRDTFFGYFKNDNHIKRKGLGRVEKTNTHGDSLWLETEELWLDLYKNRRSIPGLSITHKVSYEDEWLAEAYMDTDYSILSEEDFKKSINAYAGYLVTSNQYPLLTNTNSSKKLALNTNEWEPFKIGDYFTPQLSRGDIKLNTVEEGDIPLISAVASNNGVVGNISGEGDGIAQLFEKNQITVDMFCSAFYQNKDFYSVSHGRVNILKPNFNMTKYVALFLITLIDTEQYKWSYGRAVYQDEITNMLIKLPVDNNGNPDWQYMENYIKSLPYGDKI